MLIKKSIVEQWYVKTHPVYKNFAYLFDNPLWHGKVPKGFSVCPYFWLSIFSFFFVRPFVKLIQVAAPVRKLSKPFFILLCVAAAVLGGIIAWGIAGAIDNFYKTSIVPVPACLILWWSITALLGLMTLEHYYKSCKVHYYYYVWAVISLLAACYFEGDSLRREFYEIGGAIWTAIYLIGWGIAVGFKYLCLFLWAALKWTGRAFVWAPFDRKFIAWAPWWVCIVLFCLVSALLMFLTVKLSEWLFSGKSAAFQQTLPPLKTDWYAEWLDMIAGRAARSNYFQRVVWSLLPWPYSDAANTDKATEWWWVKWKFYDEVARAYYAPLAEALRSCEIFYPLPWNWGRQWNHDSVKLYYELHERYPGVLATELLTGCDRITLGRIVNEILAEDWFVRDWKKGVETFASIKKREEERAKAWEESWWHKKCKATTGWLGQRLDVFERSAANLFIGLKRVFRFLGRNMVIFFAYIWMLFKAKKKGVCPYYKFVDESEIKN